jgi:two-component system phosphate regulon sensor histidine kinase PhoR
MAKEGHRRSQSLARKIFSTVLVFMLGVILLLSVATTAIFYFIYEREAEGVLVQQAQDVAGHLNSIPPSEVGTVLQDQFTGVVRYTLIAEDGTVLYDSVAVAEEMDNHADRPEVRAAREEGHSTLVRYSSTLQTDSVYAAVRLDDGSILRLAEMRHSLLIFLTSMLFPMLAAVALAAALALGLSRVLTRRIMKPIDALDFKVPLQNEIYTEMSPFLERIDEQQRMLKQQNKELALAESLRRDFSSNVSHEMKTPLQVISGYAELMQNDMVEPLDSQKFAGLIYEEAQAMRSLIDDVLILSRLDESAVGDSGQPVDLYAVAAGTIERLGGFADSNGVTLSLKGDHAILIGSETITEQMFYNLLENGIRYNHLGGTVGISIEAFGSGPGLAALQGEGAGDVPPARPFGQSGPFEAGHSGTVVVKVSDTGVGIPEDMQENIFERFFRVDKSRSKETGGTGLGLAIVKHGVLYHEGTIGVESAPGEGTTFTLTFPRALEDASRGLPSQPQEASSKAPPPVRG